MEKFELEKLTLRHFDYMQEFVNRISRTEKVCSWGAHNWTNIADKALTFEVTGHHYIGPIILTVNASDLFDIYFVKYNLEIIHVIKDIHLDSLIDVIDKAVEWIPSYKR
jgi:hypothetical protein